MIGQAVTVVKAAAAVLAVVDVEIAHGQRADNNYDLEKPTVIYIHLVIPISTSLLPLPTCLYIG